jgi:hypothetical protein
MGKKTETDSDLDDLNGLTLSNKVDELYNIINWCEKYFESPQSTPDTSVNYENTKNSSPFNQNNVDAERFNSFYNNKSRSANKFVINMNFSLKNYTKTNKYNCSFLSADLLEALLDKQSSLNNSKNLNDKVIKIVNFNKKIKRKDLIGDYMKKI